MNPGRMESMNWATYLSQFDLIYDSPSRRWQDGFALGNGSLGALACEPFHLEWTVNKNNVWDYRRPVFKRHTMQEMREIAAQGKDFMTEMAKENISGTGLSPSPKTCGQLRIRFGHDSIYAPGHKITKRLNLYEGTVQTRLDKHLSHPRVSSFICAEEDLLVIKVREVSAMTAFHNKVDLYHVADALLPADRKGAADDLLWIEQTMPDGFRYVLMAKIVPVGTCAGADMFKATVQEKWWFCIEPAKTVKSQIEGEYAVAPVAGDFDIYATVVTSHDTDDLMGTARKRLADAAQKGVDALHEAHRRWWAEYWSKCYVGMDEALLEQLWYVSLYHLGSVLRGTPIGGLCGLWYGPMDTPSQMLPWMGSYTNDYNAQAPISPVFRTNHPELADGAFRTLLMQLPGAMQNARELYDMPGACYPLTADPTGLENTNGAYRFCQNSGPEWSVYLWWHYLYTRDREYLRQVTYPVMREVATFFVNYLTWHEDEQLYHLEISQNPELGYIKYTDPFNTLSLLKYTLKAVIEATGILGVDPELAKQCRHVLEHYPEYARHGAEISPLRGLRPNHMNHLRTLSGIFPCGEFDPEIAPEWQESNLFEIEKGDQWMCNYSCNQGRVNFWTGGTYFIGLSACWLGMKDIAWRYLEDLLKCNVKPNGLITHNGVCLANSRYSEANIKNIPDKTIYHDLDPDPLQMVEVLTGRLNELATDNLECKDTIFPAIEGPSIFLLMMGEMLLQSHNGILRLFSGLPEERNAQFMDLRAPGPLLVSSQRKDGQVTFVAIRALAPVACRLRSPWKEATVWQSVDDTGKDAAEVKNEPYLVLNLAAGQELVLAPARQNLPWPALIQPRHDEPAQARHLTFADGMMAWVGKSDTDEYYGALKKARDARPAGFESK